MMLSFIIPTLNEEKILERTLRSIRTLTVFPYEIIVSDGNSVDATLAIARTLADRVVVWDKPTRQTIAMARNSAAAQAKGDFFVFLDADVSIPAMDAFFSTAVQAFQIDKELAALTVWRKILPEYATLADRINFFALSASFYLMNNVLHMPASWGEFQMIPSEKFRMVGGFNETMVAMEDTDMFIRLGKLGKTRLIPSLAFFETGRRVHNLGWLRAWYLWITTGIAARWFNRQIHKEWSIVR